MDEDFVKNRGAFLFHISIVHDFQKRSNYLLTRISGRGTKRYPTTGEGNATSTNPIQT
jgi:hypothetical protein